MVFATPEWLFGLLALPLLALVESLLARGDRERVSRLVARPLWPRVVRREDERWRLVRVALVLVATAAILAALARPQWGVVREKVEREGADVVLVVDTSGSMATADVPPSRFFLARAALMNLVTRLEGDRFGLVAFEGEAHPLVPLTLDADALGLFLDSIEPGFVPTPGSSLGQGLARGLELFVDPERKHRVMVLVSDGEDLGGDVAPVVARAREAGVVVHTVGVGTERGEPVPDFDTEGRAVGFKKDESGQVVVSRLDEAALETISRGTGGRYFRLTPLDPSLSALAAAIEGLEQKSVAREYAYRRKEQYQWPLALGLGALSLAYALPPPAFWRRKKRAGESAPLARAAVLLLGLLATAPARAQQPPASSPHPSASPATSSPGAGPAGSPDQAGSQGQAKAARPPVKKSALDEVLLRPRRLTEAGRRAFAQGDHPASLEAFEDASALRPTDPRARFNLADGLYKNGRFDDAAQLYRDLGQDPAAPLAAASRFNLGNTLFQKKDYKGAISAYRDALRLAPNDMDVRRNLEMALRAPKPPEQQQKQPSPDQKQKPDSPPKEGQQQAQNPRPPSPQERERQRFEQETGMPKERAEQLLDALQGNEKAEQRKALQARKRDKKGKDW